MSSIFPSGVHLAEHYIEVNGFAASVFTVGSALGEMLIPLLVGMSFERISPTSLSWITAVTCILAMVLFAVFFTLGSRALLLPGFARIGRNNKDRSDAMGEIEMIRLEDEAERV